MPKGNTAPRKIRTLECKRCGKMFETKNPCAKWCPECRPIVEREKSRVAQARREAKKTADTIPMSGVFLENHRGISADCRAARAMGLTYGMWRARYG